MGGRALRMAIDAETERYHQTWARLRRYSRLFWAGVVLIWFTGFALINRAFGEVEPIVAGLAVGALALVVVVAMAAAISS